jgi:hypothetical protein
VPNWSILGDYKNILKSTKDSVTTGMFVTSRPCGAKPQVKGAHGPAGQLDFESVQARVTPTNTTRPYRGYINWG